MQRKQKASSETFVNGHVKVNLKKCESLSGLQEVERNDFTLTVPIQRAKI